MSNSTGERDRSAQAAGGAGRFAAPRQEPQRRSGQAVLAGLALLALVIGAPLALIWLGGAPPIPTSLPDRGDLTQPLSAEAIVTALLAVVWIVWLVFCVCLIIEVIAALRGGLARPVPLAGPVQRLARLLVGALLLAGVVSGPANAVAPQPSDGPVQSQAVVATEHPGPAAQATDSTPDGPNAARQVHDDRATPAGEGIVGKKVYTVKRHDNLWDIAHKHLSDPMRYKEIYALNHGRPQPDGSSLDMARLIQPGWQLVMPEDAVGVPRVAAVDDHGAVVDRPASHVESAQEGGDQRGASQFDAPEGGKATYVGDEIHDLARQTSMTIMYGGGLLAAAVVGALMRRRRRAIGRAASETAAATETGFRAAATLDRAEALDRALRRLAANCVAESIEVPSAYAVVLGDEQVELLLAPARPDACSGWEVLDEGRRWRAELADPDAPTHAVAPYPALVSLGVDEQGRDVLVDLEAAGGVVSILGDEHVAGEVAASIAVQAATSAWADGMRVTASQLPAELRDIGDHRIRVVDEMGEVLPEFENRLDALRTDVLTGRMERGASAKTELLVAAGTLESGIADRLTALTSPGRQALSVVTVGDLPAARWRLRVDSDGVLTFRALNIHVMANRIGAAEAAAVAELFDAARAEQPLDTGRPRVTAPTLPVDDSRWATGLKRVGVLGPLSVSGLDIEDVRLEEAQEIVTYLALRTTPVHPHVLAGAIWPRGVTDDVRDSSLQRAMAALGTDPEGRNHLRQDRDGRYLLGPDVVCDWDAFRSLLAESRSAPTEDREYEILTRALGLVRGEPLAGRPRRRYSWLAHTQVEREMRLLVVDAAHRLATIEYDDDPDGARSAARVGLLLEPTSLTLWRDVLRSAHRADGVAGARAALDELARTLEDHRVPLDAETESLINELLPGPGVLPASG